MDTQANGPAENPGLTLNVAGLLCYVLGAFTGVLFLVLDPYNKDSFVRFHAFQSIIFSIIFYLGCVSGFILYYVFLTVVPILFMRIVTNPYGVLRYSMVLWGVLFITLLSFFCYWLFLMYKAYNNERCEFPIIGKLAAKLAAGSA